jgi:hypothetical protein
VPQDPLVQVGERRTGIAAELVGQASLNQPEMRQRVGLPPAPVQGDHELPGQPFVERVRLRGGGYLGQEPRVFPAPQQQVVVVEAGRLPFGRERHGEGVQPVTVQVGERHALPEGHGVPPQGVGAVVGGAPGLRNQGAEAVEIHRFRADVECVTARPTRRRRATRAVEHGPQPRDVAVQGLPRAARRRRAPDPLDELVGREGYARLDQQCCQHGPLTRRAERDRSVLAPGGHVT